MCWEGGGDGFGGGGVSAFLVRGGEEGDVEEGFGQFHDEADPEEQADAEDTASWVRRAGRTAVLVPGDGPIGVLRKWSRQFYPD